MGLDNLLFEHVQVVSLLPFCVVVGTHAWLQPN
jgi:hypothetical protein